MNFRVSQSLPSNLNLTEQSDHEKISSHLVSVSESQQITVEDERLGDNIEQIRRHTHNGYIVDELEVGRSTSPEKLSLSHFCCVVFHAARFVVLIAISLHTTMLSTIIMQSFELVNSIIAFGFTILVIYVCATHPRPIKIAKFDEDDYLLNAIVVGPYLSKVYYFMVGLVFVATESK